MGALMVVGEEIGGMGVYALILLVLLGGGGFLLDDPLGGGVFLLNDPLGGVFLLKDLERSRTFFCPLLFDSSRRARPALAL
jgi:hypothetical protein